MASIEATCPSCGPVVCRPDDFDLRVWKGTAIYYVFTCPACNALVQKQADLRALNILLSEGLKPQIMRGPKEIAERPSGPPVSYDDLLDFHELLESEHWFESLRTANARKAG